MALDQQRSAAEARRSRALEIEMESISSDEPSAPSQAPPPATPHGDIHQAEVQHESERIQRSISAGEIGDPTSPLSSHMPPHDLGPRKRSGHALAFDDLTLNSLPSTTSHDKDTLHGIGAAYNDDAFKCGATCSKMVFKDPLAQSCHDKLLPLYADIVREVEQIHGLKEVISSIELPDLQSPIALRTALRARHFDPTTLLPLYNQLIAKGGLGLFACLRAHYLAY